MTSTGKEWIELTPFPWVYSGVVSNHLIAINDYQFVKLAGKRITEIRSYNTITNEWNEWMKFPDEFEDDWYGATIFDAKQCKLFIHSCSKFIEFDIKQKIHKIYHHHQSGVLGNGLFINGKCHIVEGMDNNKHLIWNEQQKRFDVQHQFEDFQNIWGHKLIYLKSLKTLLLIGGFIANMDGTEASNTIYAFNIDTAKWRKLAQTLPRVFFGGVIGSRNDEYVIIFGGGCWSKKIFVLNMVTMKLNECSIDCPRNGKFQAINMNDEKKEELLYCGYVRRLYNLPQFNDIMYPPFYLVKLIGKYFSLEMIYLLEIDLGLHWKINIDQIISNCVAVRARNCATDFV